mmetsp:Transcript_37108/g.81107  ORF Transcript_37108/g.81107 Transcript_37108/m.81107 type:complete len:315 (-) Transcript_37108:43-987(-)
MGNAIPTGQDSSDHPSYDYLWPAGPYNQCPEGYGWQKQAPQKVMQGNDLSPIDVDSRVRVPAGAYPMAYGPQKQNQPLSKACRKYNPELTKEGYIYDPCHPPEMGGAVSARTGNYLDETDFEDDDRPVRVFENVIYVPVPVPRQIVEEVHVPVDYVEKLVEEPVFVPEVVELPRGPVRKIPRIKYVEANDREAFRRVNVDRIVPYPEICDQVVTVERPVVQEVIRRVPKAISVPHYVENKEPRFEYIDQVFEIPADPDARPDWNDPSIQKMDPVIDMRYFTENIVKPRDPHWGFFDVPPKGIRAVHGHSSYVPQ